MPESASPRTTVFVIDDDPDLQRALQMSLTNIDWPVRLFDSPRDFLREVDADEEGLLLLDVHFPDADGVELQSALSARGDLRPIVFMTGFEKVSVAVAAMKGGATEFLVKPFEESVLIEAVERAAARELERTLARRHSARVRARLDLLSAREAQVLRQVAERKLNKQIAHELGLAEVTVKVHRANAMRKIGPSALNEVLSFLRPEAGNGG